jgi:hypothetical protein
MMEVKILSDFMGLKERMRLCSTRGSRQQKENRDGQQILPDTDLDPDPELPQFRVRPTQL